MKLTAILTLALSAFVLNGTAVNADDNLPPAAPAIQSLDAAINQLQQSQDAPATASAAQNAPLPVSAPNNSAEPSRAETPQTAEAAATDAKFASPIVYVYEFGANWCPSCRKLAPLVEEVAQKYEGFAQYIPVNVDKNQDLVKQLNIAQIPTVMVVDKRGRMLNRLVGFQQGIQLEQILQHYKAQTIASLSRKQQQVH